jgi:light-regulated signal transduction histidine kinase (bacteriophytochrome)
MNLISNAIKYRKPDVDPVIELDAVITQDGYIFTLKDNGAGFEPAQSERLFKMFGRLHAQSDYPGSGVGLAICRKIVDLYQGEITIESVGAGSGATVRFSLKNGCRQNPTIG